MAMTNLERLSVPEALRLGLSAHSRRETVMRQRISIDPGWWAKAIAEQSLPGHVAATNAEGANGQGAVGISRQDLFALSRNLDTTEDCSTFLWSVLAWGAGRRSRNMKRRLAAFADHPGSIDKSGVAMRLARTDPSAAYEQLRPRSKSAIDWLGPAFVTKILYFAGGGDPNHPSLILDARVASALRSLGWTSLGTSGWPTFTYGRYCTLLHNWAQALSAPTRQVAPDEIELWLFNYNKVSTA